MPIGVRLFLTTVLFLIRVLKGYFLSCPSGSF